MDTLTKSGSDLLSVAQYYDQSEPGYKFLHSLGGSIHMALNPDGHFNRDGYRGQVRLIEARLVNSSAQNALELGCGKGFNIVYLARRFESMNFAGVDLTESACHVGSPARRQTEQR
ncbi:MAG: class I SAM-dependent methyltransferase [Nocardioidaceae bacterium]